MRDRRSMRPMQRRIEQPAEAYRDRKNRSSWWSRRSSPWRTWRGPRRLTHCLQPRPHWQGSPMKRGPFSLGQIAPCAEPSRPGRPRRVLPCRAETSWSALRPTRCSAPADPGGAAARSSIGRHHAANRLPRGTCSTPAGDGHPNDVAAGVGRCIHRSNRTLIFCLTNC